MTDKLKTDLDQMLKEHKEIVAALAELVADARKERKVEYVSFAHRLTWHAQAEEEVYYPVAILIGEYLKLKLASASANAKRLSKSSSTKKTKFAKEKRSSKNMRSIVHSQRARADN